MKYSNTIEYNISTKLDSSGLQKLKTELQQVELTLQKMGNEKLLDGSFSEAREQIQRLGDALTKAFNPSLGVLDLSTFKTELKESGVTMQGLKDAFTQAGSEGQIAFNNLIGQLGQLDTGIQRSNSQIDKLFTTFSNTFRWGLVSSFFSQFMNAIHNSVDYVKELDDSLTQIMLVTDYNRDSMNEYAKSANEAAKALSMSTTGMTNASLVFAQQGYDLSQSQELATLSAKLANASQQDTATTSDQITAYMNAYGLGDSIEELTQQMDNWALIANVSAADVSELAKASQRAASMANAVGVSGETLAAQIATIESVTREAPEQIGNGLKTLYARFSDISGGGKDEDGIDLGKVTEKLDSIGVKVLDQFGNIRTMDEIMEDLMDVWADLDDTAKIASAQALAGKYQVNRFVALMDNRDMYEEYVGATGSAATGTLDQMNQEYAESLAGRTQKLNTTLEGLFNDVFTTDMVYPLIDALTKLADAVDTLFKSVGGGPTIILGLASAFTRLFSNNIAEQINNAALNKAVQQQRIENSQNRGALLEQLKVANPDESNQNTQSIINYAQRINELAPNLSSEQWEQANQILKEMVQNANAATQAQGELKTQLESVGTVLGSVFNDKYASPFLDDAGGINAAVAIEKLKGGLGDTKDAIQTTKEELLKFNQGLQEYQSELNKSEDEDKDFSNSLQMMSESLQVLKNYMEPSLYNRLNNVFKDLGESFDLGNASIEEITTTIKQFEGETGRVIEFLDKLSNKELSTQEIENFIKKLEELAFKAKNTEGAAEGSNKLGASYLKAAEKQLNIKDVVDMIANIGQLSFAWQSFQNLGSLWQKTDISTGEKIQQTIANLTASLPMLYTSWKKITEILKIPSFKDSTSNIQQAKDAIASAQNEIAQAQEKIDKGNSKAQSGFKALSTTLHNTQRGAAGFAKKASNGMHEVAQATEEMNKAQKDAAAATADLRQAQLSLIGSLAFAAIAAGLAIASAAWGAYQQKVQNAMATEKEALEEAKTNSENVSTTAKNWERLYKVYQETGEISQEFIDTSNDLGESLDIIGAKAFAASGRFDLLAEAVHNAEQEAAQKAIDNADMLLQGEYGKSLNGELLFNGSAQQDYQKAYRDSVFSVTSQMLTGSGVTESTAQIRDWLTEAQLMPKEADSVEQAIGKAHKALDLLKEKQETVKGQLQSDPNNQFYIDLNNQLEKAKQNFSEFLSLDDIKTADETYMTKFNNGIQLDSFKEKLKEAGTDAEALLSVFKQDSNTAAYFNESISKAEEYALALKSVEDNAQKVVLAQGHFKALSEEKLMGENNDQFFKDYNIKGINSSNQQVSLPSAGQDYYTQAMVDTAISAVENSELTEDEKIALYEGIDWSQPIDQIIGTLMQSAKDNVMREDYSDSADTTQRENLLSEKYKISDSTQNAMRSMAQDSDIVKNTQKELNEEYEQAAKSLEEYTDKQIEQAKAGEKVTGLTKKQSKELQENVKRTDKAKKAAEGYKDSVDDLADMVMQTQKGLDSLSEGWKKNGEILKDDSKRGTLEYAEALGEVQSSLGDILNVEQQYISADFVQEHLEEIEALANGDISSLDDLRAAAAQEILLNLNADLAKEDLDYLNTKLDEWAHMEVEATTTIHDEQAIATLNDLLAKGTLTAQDLNAMLNSVETDPQIEMQPGPPGNFISIPGTSIPIEVLGAKIGGIEVPDMDIPINTAVPKITSLNKMPTSPSGNTVGGNNFPSYTGNNTNNGTGSKGKSCFIAGTLVTTLTGFKPIEEIQKGDIVLSYNERIKVNEYSEVIQTMIHDTTESIYTLHIKDEQLRVTGVHRFLVTNKITCGIPQWVHAADLKVGNWVMFADGSWHVIHKIDVNIEHHTVYNFEVSHNHNYYVGRNQILAHNKGGKSCFVAGTQVSTSLGFKAIETIQPNDIVLSYNEQTGNNEYSSVVQTMIHDTKEPIYTLYIQNEQLRVTGIHRFFITKNILTGVPQWIAAENLKVGDWVLFANGTWHVIWKIEINIEQQTVYNFEVSGNHNYYVGRNQILAHNKGGGNKKNGGGKKKEISTKDKREHEKDYYEKVDSLLEKTDEVLKGIQDKQDKLIGDKARGNQNKQIRLLEKELRILKEKRDILKNQERRDVRNQIKKDDKAAERVAKKAGVDMKIPDFKRNTDGIITNYEEVSAAVDKTYNAMVDKQKAAAKAGKEELAKNIGEYIDKFDKLSKSLLEGGKRSDEIEAELKKINNEIQDATFNIQDLRIEQFKLYTEARDGLKEALESGAELKKLFRDFDSDSFMNSFSIDDTPYGDLIENMSQLDDIYNITAKDATTFYDNLINQKQEALKTEKDPDTRNALEGAIKFFENRKANISEDGLQNGYLGILTQDLTQLQEWMDNPKAAANLFGMDEASLFENFKDIYDLLLDEFKNYRQLVQETRDNILDIYNDAGEAIERQLNQFDRLSEKMERISDTYTLYYGEDSYDQLDQFYSRQGDIMQNQLNQMTAAYEYWQKAYEEALKVGDKKLIEEMQDRMDDAEDAMLDAAQDLAELWVEKFENAVEASSQHIYKDLFGSNDIDELTDNWELQKDYMDRYKDDVEKAYEIDKLRSKYLDLLDNAQGSSAQTQNRIRQQMQEQLDLLQKQNTVTEYDVKLANAKLEILQKQMALEDAQRNKNKMQLRRDTQGNYRYVYTADQGDVKEAQQDLADSEYDAYEMTKQETVANNDRAISLLQNYVEKRAAIWNKYKDDATARGIALANLESEYNDTFKALAEDFADTSAGMYDVLNWLVKNGSEDTTTAALGMLDALYDKNGEVKDKTGQDWMDMANLIGDQILPNIVEAVTKADLEMGNQVEDLEDKMVGPGGALTKIGSGADNITDSMGEAANATKDLAAATNNLFAALGADNSELQQALDKLKQYREQLEASQQTTSLLGKALNKANETIKDKNAKESYYQDSIDLMNGSKKFEVGQVVTLKKGTWVSYHRDGDQYDANGNNGFRLSKDTQVKISHVNEHHTKGYGDTSKLAKYNIGFYEASKEATKETGTGLANKSDTKKTERWHLNEDMLRQAITYDTGGYTGQWGGEETNLSKNGKLAVLHQKELVLNATDTENILAAITLMRDMTQNTISGLSTMNRMFKNNFNSSYNPVTEQRVEIQASFPNATDAEDIRAALLNLSDKAYQYANRTI